jgi:SAM-dependent methyltransferase
VSLEQLEREKYERVWSHTEYHSNSPGERLAPYFLKLVPWKSGETLIDLGCGTARASREFVAAGLQVYLLDHVNAVDPSIHLPFICANLWELPPLRGFDWFYCCDVMEHLPPEKVRAALDNIARLTSKGGFFQIALFPDEWFGEVLHLTVESEAFWAEELMKRWGKVTTQHIERRRLCAIVEER